MSGRVQIFVLVLCYVVVLVESISFMDPKVLVVVDNKQLYQSHSMLFSTLEESGYELSVKTTQDTNLSLTSELGDYLFSHLVLLCPKTFGMTTRGLERQDILDFVEAGGNVVVFANSDYEEPTSKLFESFGCELDEPKSLVLDHIHYSKDWDSQFGGKHTAVIADGVCQSSVIVGDNKSTIIYHGIGMGIFPKREWIFPILWGSPCSYSYFPDTRVVELPIVSGEETVMVAGLQSRNGARVLLTGSTDICANTLPHNSAFCSWVVRWALGQRGMLRIRNWRHRTLMNQSTTHAVSFSSSNPTTYRVEDEVEFSMDMEEWDGIERRWKPFIAKDVQLEFIMLDPYIRKNLSVTEKGSYSTRFRIPDRIGVYKFSVEYYRRGYSPVRLSQEISVRPFRHDEYERFILQAYPYYAAAWSMLLGVVIFGFLFLHGKMNP